MDPAQRTTRGQSNSRGGHAEEDHPAPARHRVGRGALWFGVLAAPIAWSAQEILATSVNGAGCIAYRDAPPPTGLQLTSGTGIVLLCFTVALFIGCLVALFVALHNWHIVHSHAEGEEQDVLEIGEGRARFMAMSGILLSAIFALLLLMNAISLFLTPQCTP
ncbi:MAG TPA: hypothetical protein VE110_13830 [Gemmatimonadaceae bacterium]|jgi:hypothetical protein|nr:hypothetical protein [Gemmatimonadaceae bacterium]